MDAVRRSASPIGVPFLLQPSPDLTVPLGGHPIEGQHGKHGRDHRLYLLQQEPRAAGSQRATDQLPKRHAGGELLPWWHTRQSGDEGALRGAPNEVAQGVGVEQVSQARPSRSTCLPMSSAPVLWTSSGIAFIPLRPPRHPTTPLAPPRTCPRLHAVSPLQPLQIPRPDGRRQRLPPTLDEEALAGETSPRQKLRRMCFGSARPDPFGHSANLPPSQQVISTSLAPGWRPGRAEAPEAFGGRG
jgi:hypothetical protein